MKGIYKADPITHAFVSSDVVADDYQLQANESFDNPGRHFGGPLVSGVRPQGIAAIVLQFDFNIFGGFKVLKVMGI